MRNDRKNLHVISMRRLEHARVSLLCEKRSVLRASGIFFKVILCGLLLPNLLTDLTAWGCLSSRDSQADTARPIDRDTICGPRCVTYLLSHYGLDHPDDLYNVVRATQWPEIREGASMEALCEFLRKRGLCAVGVDIPIGHVVAWNHPVIIHLKALDSGPGHYVVWLPESTDETAVLWTGRRSTEQIDTALLAQRMSHTVLLTSPSEVMDVAMASRRSPDDLLCRAGMSLSVGLVSAILAIVSGANRTRDRFSGGHAA